MEKKNPWEEFLNQPEIKTKLNELKGVEHPNITPFIFTPHSEKFDEILTQIIKRDFPMGGFNFDAKKRNKIVEAEYKASMTGITEEDLAYIDAACWLAWILSEGNYLVAMRISFLIGQEWGKVL